MRSGWWRRRAVATAGVLAVIAAFGLVPGEKSRSGGDVEELRHALAAAELGDMGDLYARWRRTHELVGGDRNVQIPLGGGRGFTSAPSFTRGLARLDLIAGRVTIETHELPAGAWDVWLVDNLAAPRASASIDASDDARRIGTLDTGGALTVELGAEHFSDFEVDLVMVGPSGRPPTAGGILFGMPRSFQRLYTKQRMGRLDRYLADAGLLIERGDSLLGDLASVVRANEARATGIGVDADVVLDSLVALGADLFINETFAGNGRTCATCHPASNNFTIDPLFIAELPADDPLFVAETVPALAELEVPELLRKRALILENVDGFSEPGVLRSVPHTLALSRSLGPPTCVDPEGCTLFVPNGPVLTYAEGDQIPDLDITIPDASGFPPVSAGPPLVAFPLERTGWGGDGAPGSGTLREFAIGAVVQHFTKTLGRVEGVDFRLPTDEELDALELFQLSLGRSDDIDLDQLVFKDPKVELGRVVFNTTDSANGTIQAGKCVFCHANGGARSVAEGFGEQFEAFGLPRNIDGNLVFGTGVNDLAFDPAALVAPGVAPRDGGFGVLALGPGDCFNGQFDVTAPFPQFAVTGPGKGGFGSIAPRFLPDGLCMELFNTPPLIEAADTPPFFHNNAVDSIEEAVAFYNSRAFNDNPAIQLFMAFSDSGRIGIELDASAVTAVASLLRVLNALENLRQAHELDSAALSAAAGDDDALADQLIDQATLELDDAEEVLAAVKLHPHAIQAIRLALKRNKLARLTPGHGAVWQGLVNQAIVAMANARDDMIE